MSDYGYILAPFLGWVVAQGIKFLVSLRRDGVQWYDLYSSGGFPSSHTAFVSSLTALIALKHGLESEYFALSFVVLAIVMYDAIGVRRSVGEQAHAIAELAKKLDVHIATKIHRARGHQPVEVLAGLVVGCFVGAAIYLVG